MRLKRCNVDAWLDKINLLPGQKWEIEIPKAVKQSDVVIICLSSSSISKEGYVQKEIKIALAAAEQKPEDTIYLVPLRFEDLEVPEGLKPLQYFDLRQKGGFSRLLKALEKRAKDLDCLQPRNVDDRKPTHDKKRLLSINKVECRALFLLKKLCRNNIYRILVYYDKTWKCYLLPHMRLVEKKINKATLITNIADYLGLNNKNIELKYIDEVDLESIKYSPFAKHNKKYLFRFFSCRIKNDSDANKLKRNKFRIGGKNFYWLTTHELEEHKNTSIRNIDIIRHLRDNYDSFFIQLPNF